MDTVGPTVTRTVGHVMGPTHRLTGFAAGAGVALWAGYGPLEVVLSGAFASASSHGGLSPDVDQVKLWVEARQRMPKSTARLFNHRNLSHWWGLPILAYVGVQQLSPDFRWATLMLLVGWTSHLLGDLIFGELPLDPAGRHTFGFGLDTGGFLETGVIKIGGRSRKLLPFGPARVLLSASILFILFASATN